jgi:hypothetical protein
MINVRLEFDVNKAVARRAPLFAQAQAALDTQIVKDSNQFCPKVDGTLRSSGRVDGPGMISWNMPYARRQYYLNDEVKGPIHYTTPGTMAKWFEHAKTLYSKEWLELVQRSFE